MNCLRTAKRILETSGLFCTAQSVQACLGVFLRRFFSIAFVVICLSLFAPIARAEGAKTPDSCAALGALELKCYECRPSSKQYLGTANVLARYYLDQGHEFCVESEKAKDACAQQFGIPRAFAGAYAQYWIGMTTHEEFSNIQFVQSVGY